MADDGSESGFNLHQAPLTHMLILQHLLYLCITLHKILISLVHETRKCPLMFSRGRQARRVGINSAEQIKLSKCK